MKLFSIILVSGTLILGACHNDNNNNTPAATVYYQQADEFGRPAINTVFNVAADKDAFNTTPMTSMNTTFQPRFQSHLLALNPAFDDSTNLLGLTSATFTGVLATDVLNVSTTGVTTFYDGTNVLTGRTLADDVIDVELILIFGGHTNSQNPQLTSDHVNANDKAFLTSFPYEAAPW